jgi:hypothetical protein
MIENAFELNLPKLKRAAAVSGAAQLVLTDGDVRTVVALSPTRLAVFLGGQTWLADIVVVPCLNGRLRPLLKCPRAHVGNFQSLYFWAGELACRQCHALRYRSNLAPSAVGRARIARSKLLDSLGAEAEQCIPARQPFKWRKRHQRLAARAAALAGVHYANVRAWLGRRQN